MQDIIDDRRRDGKQEEKHDLFGLLMDANEESEQGVDGLSLSDDELLGNLFVFLLGGHEVSTLHWTPLPANLPISRQRRIHCAMPSRAWPYILQNRTFYIVKLPKLCQTGGCRLVILNLCDFILSDTP